MTKYLYRIVDRTYSAGVDEFGDPYPRLSGTNIRLHLQKFPVIKQTPKGAWIRDITGEVRFILLTARKRYACSTIEEALESFKARKVRQIGIYTARLADAEQALRLAKQGQID